MNLVMQWRPTLQSGVYTVEMQPCQVVESKQWVSVSDANRKKLNPCTEKFWDKLGFKSQDSLSDSLHETNSGVLRHD